MSTSSSSSSGGPTSPPPTSPPPTSPPPTSPPPTSPPPTSPPPTSPPPTSPPPPPPKKEFEIQISSFIPSDHLLDPIYSDRAYGGDGRGFSKSSTSFRMRQKVTIVTFQEDDADGLKDGTAQNLIGVTRWYQISTSVTNGVLTAAAKADTVKGTPLMVDFAFASTNGMQIAVTRLTNRKVRVDFSASAGNPLQLGAPAIDWAFTVTVDSTNSSVPTYTLTGSHDGFPGYDVYIGSQLIYGHDPTVTGDGVGSLFPPMEYSVNTNGVVSP